MDDSKVVLDDECKEEDEFEPSKADSDAGLHEDRRSLERDPNKPSREHVTQLLRALSHDNLVELLVPYIRNDYQNYLRILHDSESDVHRRKLFVHGLPARTTEDQFRRFFEQYGEVEVVELPHAKAHSEVKFGFVVFTAIQALHRALEQPNKQFEGKEICCKVFTVRNNPLDGSPLPSAVFPQTTNRKLFVSGLSPLVGDRELFEHCRAYGDVELAQVTPGKSSGFVLFSDPNAARDALARLNKTFFLGRQISVAWYRKQEDPRFDRRNSFPNIVQPVRGSPQVFPASAGTSSFSQSAGWFNYHPYVQQDPYVLVPVPMMQPDYQESFFSGVEDQDSKLF